MEDIAISVAVTVEAIYINIGHSLVMSVMYTDAQCTEGVVWGFPNGGMAAGKSSQCRQVHNLQNIKSVPCALSKLGGHWCSMCTKGIGNVFSLHIGYWERCSMCTQNWKCIQFARRLLGKVFNAHIWNWQGVQCVHRKIGKVFNVNTGNWEGILCAHIELEMCSMCRQGIGKAFNVHRGNLKSIQCAYRELGRCSFFSNFDNKAMI